MTTTYTPVENFRAYALFRFLFSSLLFRRKPLRAVVFSFIKPVHCKLIYIRGCSLNLLTTCEVYHTERPYKRTCGQASESLQYIENNLFYGKLCVHEDNIADIPYNTEARETTKI